MIHLKAIFKFNLIAIIFLFFASLTEFFFVDNKLRNKKLIKINIHFFPKEYKAICEQAFNYIGVQKLLVNDDFQNNFMTKIKNDNGLKKYKYDQRNLRFVPSDFALYRGLNKKHYNHDIGIHYKKENLVSLYLEYENPPHEKIREIVNLMISDYTTYVVNILEKTLIEELEENKFQLDKFKELTNKTDLITELENNTIDNNEMVLEYLNIYKKLNCDELILDDNFSEIITDDTGDVVELKKHISVQHIILKYLIVLVILNVTFLVIYGRKLFK